MTEANEKRAIAFIRTVGNRCMTCLRRNEENCRNCISSWANSILRDIDSEARSEIDYSMAARMMMIVDCLVKSGRPLLSAEIDLKKYCTKQLKRWTLLKMIQTGRIGRERTHLKNPKRYAYRYFLKPSPAAAATEN